MNNKILSVIIFILVLAAIVGAAYYFSINWLGKGDFSYKPGPLSEQSDKEKFNEYFNKISSAKLPFVEKPNISDLTPTNSFTTADLFCVTANMKKTVLSDKLSYAIYDKDANEYKKPKDSFRVDLLIGDNLNCEVLESFRVGEYEYKLYIEDVLVAVLPFRVMPLK